MQVIKNQAHTYTLTSTRPHTPHTPDIRSETLLRNTGPKCLDYLKAVIGSLVH